MDLFQLLESSSSSSSSSGDDQSEIVACAILSEALLDNPKNKHYVENTVPLYSDKQFVDHFRVSKEIFNQLKEGFERSNLYPKKETGYQKVTSEKCILSFLWYASNEAVSFRDVADRFDLSVSTLHRIIKVVCHYVSTLSDTTIIWPCAEECRRIAGEFGDMGFPDVVGCIDGTHIRIDAPSDDPDSYLNRKKYHSIQAQVVCDSRRKICDIFVGFPGSVHDARVFRNSPLCNSLFVKCNNYFILGDSAYPCLRNLLTPYKDTGNLTTVQKNYNRKLSHCRVIVEHTVGLLKQRFRQLYHLKSRDITFVCHFIRACCVLHNLCIDARVEETTFNMLENKNLDNDNPQLGTIAATEGEEAAEHHQEADVTGLNFRDQIAANLQM